MTVTLPPIRVRKSDGGLLLLDGVPTTMRLRAEVRPASVNVEKRTATVTVSTGARVRIPRWFDDDFLEELGLSANEVDLEFFSSGRAPVLDSHGWFSSRGMSVIDAQLGHVLAESVKLVEDETMPQGVRLDADVEIGHEGDDRVDRFLVDMEKGVRGHNWSVGFEVRKFRDVTEAEDELTVLRAIDWKPKEVSPVPIGADEGAKLRSAEISTGRCVVLCSGEAPASRAFWRSRVADGESAMKNWRDRIRALVAEAKLDESFADSLIARAGDVDAESKEAVEKVFTEARAAIKSEVERKRAAPEPSGGGGSPQPSPQPSPTPSVDVEAVRAEERKAERQRCKDIRQAVRQAGLEDSVAEEMIERGDSVDKARASILEKLEQRTVQPGIRGANGVSVEKDQWDKVRESVQLSFEARCGLAMRQGEKLKDWRPEFDPTSRARYTGDLVEYDERSQAFAGMSLVEVGREMLRLAGHDHRGSKSRIFDKLWSLRVRAGGDMGTSDFPEILANVMGKALRQGYDAAPRTWMPLSIRRDAPDFKQQSRVQLGQGTQLEDVGEHGEFKRGTMGEMAEKYTLGTSGKIYGFTRQAFVNDDLNAFSRAVNLFGRNAAELESDKAWAIITSNQVMGDSKALFHADHGNLAATGIALGLDSLNSMRLLARKATEIDGRRINVSLIHLIVPAALETTAEQLVSPVARMLAGGTNPAAPPTDANPYAGMNLIVEPRLDENSAIAHYMAASSGQIDLLEHAYLEGEGEGPQIFTKEGWDVDGTEIKVRLDFAVAPLEWRGIYKQPGA